MSKIPSASYDIITKELEKQCIEIVNTIELNAFIIDKSIAVRAKHFIDYCNNTKLILCSYVVDPYVSFDEIIQHMCDQAATESEIANQFSDMDVKMLKAIKRCILTQWNVVKPAHITNNNEKVEYAHLVFEKMVELKLGSIITQKAKNNWDIKCLRKVTTEEIENDPNIGKTIQALGLKLTEIVKHFSESEEREPDENRTKSLKRQQSTELEPIQEAKRYKASDVIQVFTQIENKKPPNGASTQRLHEIINKTSNPKQNNKPNYITSSSNSSNYVGQNYTQSQENSDKFSNDENDIYSFDSQDSQSSNHSLNKSATPNQVFENDNCSSDDSLSDDEQPQTNPNNTQEALVNITNNNKKEKKKRRTWTK